MSQSNTPVGFSIVAVYPDHPAAEHAVRKLHKSGFAMPDLSIVGRDFQVTEEPIGFVSAGDYAKAGAETGAWFGGLFGLFVGAAFLILPGVGPIVVAGPLAAALLGGDGRGAGRDCARKSGRRTRRVGCSPGPSAQVRDASQRRQIPRDRPGQRRDYRSRPLPVDPRGTGARRILRAANGVNPIMSPGIAARVVVNHGPRDRRRATSARRRRRAVAHRRQERRPLCLDRHDLARRT